MAYELEAERTRFYWINILGCSGTEKHRVLGDHPRKRIGFAASYPTWQRTRFSNRQEPARVDQSEGEYLVIPPSFLSVDQ